MPFFDEFDDEEEQTNQVGAEQVIASGQSGQINGGPSTGVAAPTKSAEPTKSGSWTNLISYVKANEGNDARMGESVKSGFQDKTAKASETANTWKVGADGQIKSNTILDNNNVSSNLENDPSKVNQEDFSKLYNAQYEGPNAANEVEGWDDINNQYNEIGERTQNLDHFEGRQGLLKDAFGQNQQYSRGENTLDSFILGSGEGGIKALEETKGIAQDAQGQWGSNQKAIADAALAARSATDSTREKIRGDFSTATGAIDKTLKANLAAADTQAKTNKANFTKLENEFNSKDAKTREAAYKKLGVDSKTGEFLRSNGLSLTEIAKYGGSQNLGDLTSVADQARFSALSELAGSIGSSLGSYDFTKSGNDGNYLKADKTKLDAGTQASKIYEAVNNQVKQEKLKQALDFEMAQQALSGEGEFAYGRNPDKYLAEALGVDTAMLKDYRAKGGDPLKLLSRDKAEDIGADDFIGSDAKSYGQLLKTLGLENKAIASKNDLKGVKFDSSSMKAWIDQFNKAKAAQDKLKDDAIPDVPVVDVSTGGATNPNTTPFAAPIVNAVNNTASFVKKNNPFK